MAVSQVCPTQPSAVTWLSEKEGLGELGEPFREADPELHLRVLKPLWPLRDFVYRFLHTQSCVPPAELILLGNSEVICS